MRAGRLIVVIALIGALVPAVAVSARCSAAPPGVFVHLDTTENTFDPPFFAAAEGDGTGQFVVRRIGDNCDFLDAYVSYSSTDITATRGEDYAFSGDQRVGPLGDPAHGPGPPIQQVPFDVVDDSRVDEPAVETTRIFLHDPQNAALIEPSEAPLYIIDNDAPGSSFSFGETEYLSSESDSRANVPVFRSGSAEGSATVTYSLAPGGSPATEGSDFRAPAERILQFQAGERVKTVALDIVNDSVAEASETVVISLGPGAVEPSSTTLTIRDNEESIRPRSRLHHPRQWRTYSRSDYRIREIHVFTRDETGGSGVARAQVALRKNLTSGRCKWLVRGKFEPGRCRVKRWSSMRPFPDQEGLFYFFRLPALRPSAGTRIRNYKMFSRAIDAAGNAETAFTRGRNANTFEIRR